MVQEDELFQIRLNDKGRAYIRKFFSVIRVSAVLIGIFFLLNLYLNVKYLYELYLSSGTGTGLVIPLRAKIFACAYLLLLLINAVGMLYYIKFAIALNKSIDLSDEEMFNKAFRLALKNAVIFGITIAGDIILVGWPIIQP